MQRSLIAAAIAATLAATAPVAAAASAGATHVAATPTGAAQHAARPVTLDTISVTATLDQARNGLSPQTGSSEYVIAQQAITGMPLGASTPLNQVLLQAPGVVQDSFGQIHVRGNHANLQYRINGVILPESIAGFGQTLDTRIIHSVKLLDGALPAQFGERTAGIVDITTRSGADLGNGGEAGITGGSFGTVNPFVSAYGKSGRWSGFFTANYLQNDVGIQNPTPSRNPIHDRTHQVKGFGDVSYLINDDTRASFMFGVTNNRFEIPNNPDQLPVFQYLDQAHFDSADLNERQRELTRFGIFTLQGKMGVTNYQVSLGQRFSGIDFQPDTIGDLMFNGVAASINQGDRASTLQADFSTPLGDSNTLRYGLFANFDKAGTVSHSLVFPANAEGEQTSTTPLAIPTDSRVSAKTWAGYVQDQWNVSDNWTLNYGVRGDVYQAFGETHRQLSPRIGMVWYPNASTTVHAGYARYFIPPQTELISTADILLFANTTNAVKNRGNNIPLPSRSNYFDVGVQQNIGPHWTLGLDTYYQRVRDLQDEGQFGAALIFSTFNYEFGRVRGTELSANYHNGPVTGYFNFAYNKAQGKRVVTSQYNFDPADLAYIDDHYIYLDHDQKFTSSGGLAYTFADGARIGADYLFGTGLREEGLTPNGMSLPTYFQLNLTVARELVLPGLGKVHTQLALVNVLDRVYELRSGTGIGVGAPQFGPRRGVFLTVSREF